MTTVTLKQTAPFCKGWGLRREHKILKFGAEKMRFTLDFIICERTGKEWFWPPLMEPGVPIPTEFGCAVMSNFYTWYFPEES